MSLKHDRTVRCVCGHVAHTDVCSAPIANPHGDDLCGCDTRTLVESMQARNEGPMHEWFSLSYSSYLVLPRALIQEMPIEWQERLRRCLVDMETEFPSFDGVYQVQLRNADGVYAHDPLSEYRRPDYGAIALARTARCYGCGMEDGTHAPDCHYRQWDYRKRQAIDSGTGTP